MTFNMDIETADGEVVAGYTSVTSHGRAGMECFAFSQGIESIREKGTGRSTGRRNMKAIKATKRIDKATPVLSRILCNNEKIKVKWSFYKSNEDGTGTTDHFFTVTIEGARIASQEIISRDASDEAFHAQPMMEELSFVYRTITWEDVEGGTMHTDSWDVDAKQ